jgi:hypothetical protein
MIEYNAKFSYKKTYHWRCDKAKARFEIVYARERADGSDWRVQMGFKRGYLALENSRYRFVKDII